MKFVERRKTHMYCIIVFIFLSEDARLGTESTVQFDMVFSGVPGHNNSFSRSVGSVSAMIWNENYPLNTLMGYRRGR